MGSDTCSDGAFGSCRLAEAHAHQLDSWAIGRSVRGRGRFGRHTSAQHQTVQHRVGGLCDSRRICCRARDFDLGILPEGSRNRLTRHDRPPDSPSDNGQDEAISETDITRKKPPIESAAIAGIVYAVLAIAAWELLTRSPQSALTDQEVSAWFGDPTNRSLLILGLNLAAVSSVLFLWFVAVIRRRLGDREDRFFATVFFGSAIVYVAIWLVSAASLAAPAVAYELSGNITANQGTSTVVRGLAAGLILVAGSRIEAVFVISTSALFLRTGIAPKWLAYFGYVVGLGLFIIPTIRDRVGAGFPIWVFIVSVTVLVRRFDFR